METPEERYACQHKACGKDDLDVGQIWSCADCGEDFCEQHTKDVSVDGEFAIYVCAGCLLKREERKKPAASERFYRTVQNSQEVA